MLLSRSPYLSRARAFSWFGEACCDKTSVFTLNGVSDVQPLRDDVAHAPSTTVPGFPFEQAGRPARSIRLLHGRPLYGSVLIAVLPATAIFSRGPDSPRL